MKKNIVLTVRCSDTNMDKQDYEFIKKEVARGTSKSELLKEAINIYRRYRDGSLIVEFLEENNLLNKDNISDMDIATAKGKLTPELQKKKEKSIKSLFGESSPLK